MNLKLAKKKKISTPEFYHKGALFILWVELMHDRIWWGYCLHYGSEMGELVVEVTYKIHFFPSSLLLLSSSSFPNWPFPYLVVFDWGYLKIVGDISMSYECIREYVNTNLNQSFVIKETLGGKTRSEAWTLWYLHHLHVQTLCWLSVNLIFLSRSAVDLHKQLHNPERTCWSPRTGYY